MPDAAHPDCPVCKKPMPEIMAHFDAAGKRIESRDFYCHKHNKWDEVLFCTKHKERLALVSSTTHLAAVGDNKMGRQFHKTYKCPASGCDYSPVRITRGDTE